MATSTSIPVSSEDRGDKSPTPPGSERTAPPRAGFFTIHKPTQGRTTRLVTGAAALLLLGLTVHFLLTQVSAWFFRAADGGSSTAERIWFWIVVVLGTILAAFLWRLINKPDNAEFLIATDSEMKKVSWTSRKQLWGSTKVVIFFMLAIAGILFVVDLVFHWLFYFVDVLKFRPLGM